MIVKAIYKALDYKKYMQYEINYLDIIAWIVVKLKQALHIFYSIVLILLVLFYLIFTVMKIRYTLGVQMSLILH